MGVGHFLFSLALGATRFPVGSFHVVHQFFFPQWTFKLSFMRSLTLMGDVWNPKTKGSRTVFASIKHDQTLVRLQEPFHILHRPSLIGKTWVFPKIRGVSPKWMVKIMENPLFSETSTCTSWDLWAVFPPVAQAWSLRTLAVGDLSIAGKGVQLHNLNLPRHPNRHRNWEDMTGSPPKLTWTQNTEREEVWLDVHRVS